MRALITFSLLTGLCFSSQVSADTVYIRDTLYVPLRGGQSQEHRILHRGLRSGSALERLEENEETGYSRVRTDNGLEGWLQTQYLVSEPIAATRLETMQTRLDELEASHQQTLLRLREANKTGEMLSSNSSSLAAANTALQQELDALKALAADVIAINEENQRLNEKRATLKAEIDHLANRNSTLQDNQTQRWFLTGGGTVLIGLLFGFWVGRRIYQRRSASGWA